MGYADPQLNADFQAAIELAENLEGNIIVIQGTPYPCVLGVQSNNQVFDGEGPYRNVQRVLATVRKNLFPVAPVLGNKLVTAGGNQWRVFEVATTAMTYELTLESPSQ